MKYNTNKISIMSVEKFLLPILLIGIITFGGYLMYSNTQNEKVNKEFVFDVVRSLNEIYKSRDLDDNQDSSNKFLAAYSMKEHIEDAEKLIKKWENDDDELRNKIARDMLVGITDLKTAANTYINLLNKPTEEDMALFKIKLDDGREQLFAAGGIVLSDDGNGIKLSESQKQDIIDFIDSIFEKEIQNFEENGQEENFSQPQEIWAAVIIRNGLTKQLSKK